MRRVSQDIKPSGNAHNGPCEDADDPGLAVRRHTDRCFFAVEEVVRDAAGDVEGYVVEGFLIPKDEIAEVRSLLQGQDQATICRSDPPPGDARGHSG